MDDETTQPGSDDSCRLCGLPVRGRTDGFCCSGCRHVHAILKEVLAEDSASSMQDHPYFQRMREMGVIPSPEGESADRSSGHAGPPSHADSEEMEERVLKVEGMWCPSCSWVIEHVAGKIDGVVEARASFHSDRLHVKYLPRLVGGDQIAKQVESLGYSVAEPGESAERTKRYQNELLRLGTAVFFTVNVMMLSFGLYQGFFTELSPDMARLIGWPIFLFATVIIFFSGGPILKRALAAARNRAFVMETLTSLGALSAYVLSVVELLRGSLHLYFDTASMLITLVLLGKFLETRIRLRASSGIEEIYALVPTKARIQTEAGERFASIETVHPGNRIVVEAGETIPADGEILFGTGSADESKLTGENKPSKKGPGDTVLAGSVLLGGGLTIRVKGAGGESSIGRMVSLMEKALIAKNPFELLADRVVAWFVPVIILIAIATASYLVATGNSAEAAMVRAVTVLVIACPCALGIATPLAKVAAVGRARKAGVLVTNPDALENAVKIDELVLDKTGTVTQGLFQALEMLTLRGSQSDMLALVAAAEAGSEHPIAKALRELAAAYKVEISETATNQEHVQGMGIAAMIAGRQVRVGNEAFLTEKKIAIDAEASETSGGWSQTGDTVVYVAADGELLGLIRLGDRIRDDMAATIAELQKRGIEIRIVSGDTPAATKAVADKLGIGEYEGGALPERKVQIVRELQEKGLRVGMVGDGANDAAALAAADVGFATGEALNVTKNASDVTLLKFSGKSLTGALDLATITVRAIRMNLGFALFYNLTALPLALLGFVNPIIAVSAMLASSLTVVTNSARIARSI
jgi:heavy metal translocating P-type ATPase